MTDTFDSFGLDVEDPAPVSHWDEEVEVLVVGYGAAGVSAALQARLQGADVLALDRFAGGGATHRSGGVVYLGGGTPEQGLAGFEDDTEGLLGYLRTEARDAVSEDTLRSFSERSLEDRKWLQAQGIAFTPGFFPGKAMVPPDDCGLYFSGNERQHAASAHPAPRGHRVDGEGMTGGVLFDTLAATAATAGVDVRHHTRPTRLVVDDSGAVVGAEILTVEGRRAGVLHRLLAEVTEIEATVATGVPISGRRALARFERRHGRLRRIRALNGVVLCSGGFVFNPDMRAAFATPYADATPLGTPGDDGSGIVLGSSAGGALRQMNECAASRFLAPPEVLMGGVLVDSGGERICDESIYAATLSRYIAPSGGRAVLVIDAEMHARAREEISQMEGVRGHSLHRILQGGENHVLGPMVFGLINLHMNRRKAQTLTALAAKCGIPAEGLRSTVIDYNRAIEAGDPDPQGKASRYCAPLTTPPFYAIRCDLDSRLFPATCLTLGGLDVDGHTQQVLRDDASAVPGLYAAGRTAVGVASRSYVSGLSLADCIFSGRNAGLAVSGTPPVATP